VYCVVLEVSYDCYQVEDGSEQSKLVKHLAVKLLSNREKKQVLKKDGWGENWKQIQDY